MPSLYSFQDSQIRFRMENRVSMALNKTYGIINTIGVDFGGSIKWDVKDYEGVQIEVSEEATVTVPPRGGKPGEPETWACFQQNTYAARVTFPDDHKVCVVLPPGSRSSSKKPVEWFPAILDEANRLLCLGETAGILEAN